MVSQLSQWSVCSEQELMVLNPSVPYQEHPHSGWAFSSHAHTHACTHTHPNTHRNLYTGKQPLHPTEWETLISRGFLIQSKSTEPQKHPFPHSHYFQIVLQKSNVNFVKCKNNVWCKNVDFIAKKNQPYEIVPRVKGSEVAGARTHSWVWTVMLRLFFFFFFCLHFMACRS